MGQQQMPTPRNSTDRYLAAIHDVLGEIRDRLPQPPHAGQAAAGDGVELREPAALAPAGGSGEPSRTSEDGGGPGGVPRPARTPRPTVKKPAATRRTTKPKEK